MRRGGNITHRIVGAAVTAALAVAGLVAASLAERNGPLPGPLPLFPADNWWNQDISQAPVDPRSLEFINFIGPADGMHPDFGGTESPGSQNIYGMPFVVVGGDQAKVAVGFDYADESDGVNHQTGQSYPFYPIPEQAITEPYWIEGGPPGNANVSGDRHMLIVDRDHRHLYELFALRWTRLAVGSRVWRLLRSEHERPAARGLDVGRCGWTGDPAWSRPLRRGVRPGRDPPRVPRHRARREQLRVAGVAPREHEQRRPAAGRAAAPEGVNEHQRISAVHPEDLPCHEDTWADRRRHGLGPLRERRVRHTVEQRPVESGVPRDHSQRFRGDPAGVARQHRALHGTGRADRARGRRQRPQRVLQLVRACQRRRTHGLPARGRALAGRE